jgi:hypothetical protein
MCDKCTFKVLPFNNVQVFPNIPAPGGENVGFSECARKHLAVKPRKGDAVLFHSIAPHGALEKKSLHAACPVIKVGERQGRSTTVKHIAEDVADLQCVTAATLQCIKLTACSVLQCKLSAHV